MTVQNDPDAQDKPKEGTPNEERRKRINEAENPLPGDKERAEHEDPHADDALDTGTSDGTTNGG